MRFIVLFKVIIALCVASLATVAGTSAQASVQYTGTIYSPSDLVLAGNWTNASLSWTVTDNQNGTWNYSYSFAYNPVKPGLSHFIFEISTNVTSLDLFTNFSGNYSGNPEFALGNEGNSNPDIPGNFSNGIKFNFPSNTEPAQVSFDIARVPTWGDFYSKGGNPTNNFGSVHNSGFVPNDANDPLAPPADGVHYNSLGQAHILVPDSVAPTVQTVTPEATSFLIWSGLATAVAYGAHRRSIARIGDR